MAKQVLIWIPETEEEKTEGLTKFYESCNHTQDLIRSINSSLSFLEDRLQTKKIYRFQISDSDEFITITRCKTGVRFLHPETHAMFLMCKMTERLDYAEYISRVWMKLKDPMFIHDLVLALEKEIDDY